MRNSEKKINDMIRHNNNTNKNSIIMVMVMIMMIMRDMAKLARGSQAEKPRCSKGGRTMSFQRGRYIYIGPDDRRILLE